MVKGTAIQGAPMPLFDRLTDLAPDQPEEKYIQNYLDESGVETSISRELGNILTTRLGSIHDPYLLLEEESEESAAILPEDFGLRDFSSTPIGSLDSHVKIAEAVKAAILRFEPRLKEPVVTVSKSDLEHGGIELMIEGVIQIGSIVKVVQFPRSLT